MMWRLLWAFVFVGVTGGVAKEEVEVEVEGRLLTLEEIYKLQQKSKTAEEQWAYAKKWEACEGEEDEELCRKGFLFTATALNKVREEGDCAVVLSLERSLHPHVTFDVSLRTLGDKDHLFSWRGYEEEWPEEKVLAREKVTLGVNELRRVELRVSDLAWKTAYLVVTAHPTGHSESGRHTYTKIQKATSEVEVFVQTDKPAYAFGDTVNYRALVVDRNVEKTPKFTRVFSGSIDWAIGNWVEVPESGIVRGSFMYHGQEEFRVRATSDVTSSDFSVTPKCRFLDSLHFTIRDSDPSPLMAVTFEGLNDAYFSQQRLKGRVKLTSTQGIPLNGNCNVTIQRDLWEETVLKKEMAGRSVAVGLAGGEFQFDVGEELGAELDAARESAQFKLQANCRDLQSGIVANATQTLTLWRNLFVVNLLSVGGSPLLQEQNSSHPQETVVLKFLVERRDGGSVEEQEPSKGLQVRLLLSKENVERLRPSATNFSLPIRPDGRVRLEFKVIDTPPSPWEDTIAMDVGDVKAEATLDQRPRHLPPSIHVTPIDPARLIQRGDVVRFHVRSCIPYDNVNVILSSHKAIYFSQRFSFSPEGEELDEVIELTIPQNATEGSLNLLVYGLSTSPHNGLKKGDRQSIRVNVVPSKGPQFITIVDQVDVDMSTIVTFRLEGMPPHSVVSLQAAKLESPEGVVDGKKDEDRSFTCLTYGYADTRDTTKMKYGDYSPNAVVPEDVEISSNFGDLDEWYTDRHPQFVFVDFDRKTSMEDNGTVTVTKTFDRLTEFGTSVVSGATFHSKSGRTVFSNSPLLRILPLPVSSLEELN